jgi:hypothetical protein
LRPFFPFVRTAWDCFTAWGFEYNKDIGRLELT